MDVIVVPVLGLVVRVIDLYIWVVVAGVILSWLVAANVINRSNRFVYLVADFVYRVTEPALRPIRSRLPSLGAFDLSPVVLIFILWAMQEMLIRLIARIA